MTTKWLTVLLLLLAAGLAALIAIGGWSVLEGGNGMGSSALIYAILYFCFAFLVARWRRGILPLAAALSMILAIFCAVGADSWFARDKSGFSEAALSSSLVGVLVIILAVVQLAVIVVALYGFNQAWNVEEERPIGNGENYGAGAGGDTGLPSPPERHPRSAVLYGPHSAIKTAERRLLCRRRDSNPQARKGNRF